MFIHFDKNLFNDELEISNFIYTYIISSQKLQNRSMCVGESDNVTISYTTKKNFVPGIEDEALAGNSLGITQAHKTEGRCTCCDHN